MSPEREREFQELAAFIDFYVTRFWRIDPASPTHPTKSLAQIVDKVGKSKALEGLRQAANDIIESLSAAPRDEILHIDNELRAAGILSVSELRVSHSRQYQNILRRGSIRTETEYYLVKEIVDGASLSEADAQKLSAMISDYEQRQT